MESSRRQIAIEVALAYGAAVIATAAIALAANRVAGLAGYEQLLVCGVFLFLAMRYAKREPDGMRRYGIDLSGLLVPPDPEDPRPAGPLGIYDLLRSVRAAWWPGVKESGIAIAIAIVIFPPFVVGFNYWYAPRHAFQLVIDSDTAEFALSQLLVVALPEEAFFRGYLQTRLTDLFPKTIDVRGLVLSIPAWLLTALCFALIHYVSIPQPTRLAVFFPALLFGLLRAWRKGIGAAMLLHAMSNVLAHILERGYQL